LVEVQAIPHNPVRHSDSKEGNDNFMNLIAICTIAFIAVFVILSFLAGVMRLITTVFPVRSGGSDAPLVAAISSAVANVFPGARVTRIEEQR
jgi:hypothetical protein